MATGTIVTTVEDAIAVAFQILESAKNEIVWLIPPSLLSLSSTYDITDKVKVFIQNGGGFSEVSQPYRVITLKRCDCV
ncbi:MAG: hypothetical protein ACXV49_05570 [Halobacteriota archaeon]